jgi:site-specific DNA recombinase
LQLRPTPLSPLFKFVEPPLKPTIKESRKDWTSAGNRASLVLWGSCPAGFRASAGLVSHAILQNRRVEAGSVARVPAPEIETLVRDGLRRHLGSMGDGEPMTATADRDLIEHRVARVIVKPQALEVYLIPTCEASAQTEDPSLQDSAPRRPLTTTITLPWTAPIFAAVKGIINAPCTEPAMRPESRDALLAAIAKARGWIDDIRLGRIGSFAEIAEREAQGERHIRLLASLAFLSPRVIAAIVDGTAPGDLTVTGLAKALPYSWAEQEQSIGL